MTLRAKLSSELYVKKPKVELHLDNYIILPEFQRLLKQGKEGQRYIYNDYESPDTKAIYRVYYPTQYKVLGSETPEYTQKRLHSEKLVQDAKFTKDEVALVTDIPGVAHLNGHKLALKNYANTLKTTHAFLNTQTRMSGSCTKKNRYTLIVLSKEEGAEYKSKVDDLIVTPNNDGSLTYHIKGAEETLTGIITKEELQKQLIDDHYSAFLHGLENKNIALYYHDIINILEQKKIALKKLSHFFTYIARSTINYGNKSPLSFNPVVEWVFFYSNQYTLKKPNTIWPAGVTLARNLPWFLIEPGLTATDKVLLNQKEMSSPEYQYCLQASQRECLSIQFILIWQQILKYSEPELKNFINQELAHTIYVAAGLKRGVTWVLSDESIVDGALATAKQLGLDLKVDACSVHIPQEETQDATAFMQALKMNKHAVCDRLFMAGANIHARDNRGYSALDYAIMGNNHKFQAFLIERGVVPLTELSLDVIYYQGEEKKPLPKAHEIIHFHCIM